MSEKKTFFAGQEEVFARLASLVINCLFFTIFIVAKDYITLQWKEMLIVLGIFWILYELVAILLFQMFVFFSSNRKVEHVIPETAKPIEDIDQSPNQ